MKIFASFTLGMITILPCILSFFFSQCHTFQGNVDRKKTLPHDSKPSDRILDDIFSLTNNTFVSTSLADKDSLGSSSGVTIPLGKKKKGKRFRTRIQASRLIRDSIMSSGKNVGSRKKRIQRLILSGNAIVSNQKFQIRADEIVIHNKATMRLKRNVRLHDRERNIFVYSQKGYYDRNQQRLTLQGKPYLKHKKRKSKTILISCREIVYLVDEGVAFFKGTTKTHHEDWTSFSDSGKYLGEKAILYLEGSPILVGKGRFMSGDTFLYKQKEQTLISKGRAVLYFQREAEDIFVSSLPDRHLQDPSSMSLLDYARNGGGDLDSLANKKSLSKKKSFAARNRKKSAKSTGVLTADELHYHSKKGLEAFRKVALSSEDLDMKASYLRLFGPKKNHIQAQGNVYAKSHKNSTIAEGDFMEYIGKKKRLSLIGNAKVTLKNDAQGDSILSAYLLEQFKDKKVFFAHGNVQFQKNSYFASSEQAKYHEQSKILLMEGNAKLSREGESVESQKILIYTEKDQIVFPNRLEGYLGGN